MILAPKRGNPPAQDITLSDRLSDSRRQSVKFLGDKINVVTFMKQTPRYAL